ncbi:hypothetical protein [Flavobacterium polysaccharolyticum]|uniref:Lipoprotein n=1 Tax=Flavobacterium polysaccharolyticum TaxID=3133148 RepID=A0ABU9NKX7_9FLAO
MKNLIVLIVINLLYGCNKKEEAVKESNTIPKPYIISQENKKITKEIKKTMYPLHLFRMGFL